MQIFYYYRPVMASITRDNLFFTYNYNSIDTNLCEIHVEIYIQSIGKTVENEMRILIAIRLY